MISKENIEILENTLKEDKLIIAGREIKNRLFVGTGKFDSVETLLNVVKVVEPDIVTVAVRRLNPDLPGMGQALDYLMENTIVMVNTSGAKTAEEAFKIAKIAEKAGLPKWVKIEITPDPKTLLPDPTETLKAAEMLVRDGWVVLPYINTDPILAKKLEDIGVVAVMPLGSLIGTNRGISNKDQLEIIIERANVPVVIDAGIGRPSHAAEAMEMGADAVLVNTAFAVAQNPKEFALSMKMAVLSGRLGYLSGLPSQKKRASASSPTEGLLKFLE